ncbi:MAG: DUF3575 domain-containing protein [Chitinophagales bacterium]|nr:DUF3575 domain-containing protein [Chitinophagales bacterium]
MKQLIKIFTFALLMSIGFASQTQAQVDVSVNPIGLLFGNLSVSGDFVLSDKFSVEGQVGFGTGNDLQLDYFSLPVTVFGKYYFNPDDPAEKFYADAFLRFIARNYTAEDGATNVAEYTQTRLGFGFGIGYKVVGSSGIVFDIGFGVGRAITDKTTFETEGDQIEVDWPKLMFAGKLGIGYRFGGK